MTNAEASVRAEGGDIFLSWRAIFKGKKRDNYRLQDDWKRFGVVLIVVVVLNHMETKPRLYFVDIWRRRLISVGRSLSSNV